MTTKKEKSENNFYIYEKEEGHFGPKIAYRKNVAKEIKNECPGTFDAYNPDHMTDKSFREFIGKAEEKGYKIYKLIRL